MELLSPSGYVAFEALDRYESVKEVQPESRQYFRGGNFTLLCPVIRGNSTGWILKRLQGAETRSGCLQLNGTESTDKPEECHFIDIDYKNSGLYWCESPAENKRRNTVNITVSYDSEDEKTFTGSLVWVSGLCVILVLLVLFPVLWLLFPGFRENLHVCPNRAFRRERVQQEMPKTKQDMTEIQWDLPWMEMDNLLDKHQNPGS
ncbi:uncharacterized protein LOC132152298 [Carassius carassius]|uniref:uncharacterized protein LOC132152298 n=1 Tax=Carassius carassius TaxID=217509 RepID=UPI0028692468|nr:uncharacterized protein LOC132152298 [Carassius carassius]